MAVGTCGMCRSASFFAFSSFLACSDCASWFFFILGSLAVIIFFATENLRVCFCLPILLPCCLFLLVKCFARPLYSPNYPLFQNVNQLRHTKKYLTTESLNFNSIFNVCARNLMQKKMLAKCEPEAAFLGPKYDDVLGVLLGHAPCCGCCFCCFFSLLRSW